MKMETMWLNQNRKIKAKIINTQKIIKVFDIICKVLKRIKSYAKNKNKIIFLTLLHIQQYYFI